MSKLYLLFVLLPLFYLVKKNVRYRAIIKNGNHTQVFYFLSNVTKFKILNPTIISIDKWERMNETDFYVEYTECLSQVPAVTNQAQAYYKIQQDADGSFSLFSRHLTCFYTKYVCLSTDSLLHITKLSKTETGYEEQIFYSCPWLLSQFCNHEIAFQRNSITNNLNKIFSNREKYISIRK